MLQKAFGFHEAQTAWAFLRSARAGEGKKKDRKKEKNGMRGEGLGFPLQRHRHLLPVQPPRLCQASPGTKPKICFVSGSAWGAHGPHGDGIAQHLFPCLHLLPAVPWSWQLRCGRAAQLVPNLAWNNWGTSAPELALGEANPARGAPCTPFPARFWYQDRHGKDVSLGKGCGCPGSTSLW